MNFAEFACLMNKLKIQQSLLEKNEKAFIVSRSTNYLDNFEIDFKCLKAAREQELNDLLKEVNDTVSTINSLKKLLSNVELNEMQIDVAELENKMLNFEQSISYIKKRLDSELNELSNQENKLTTDLTNIEKRLLRNRDEKLWKNSTNSACELKGKEREFQATDFADFIVKHNGHEGGWPHNDHLVFIRLFNKITNRTKLLAALKTLLPDVSENDFLKHIEWYKNYTALKTKQRETIEKWRKTKEIQKLMTESEIKESISKDIINKEEIAKKTKEKLQKWKLEKQLHMEEQKKIQKSLAKERKKVEKQNKLKQQQIKEQVEKWKMSKSAKEKAEKLEKEIELLKQKEKQISLTNKLIRDFQKQDIIYIEKKLNLLQSKLCTEKVSLRKLKRNQERNPERIFKYTEQWISRISMNSNGTQKKQILLKDIPKLGMPEWRDPVRKYS